MDSKENNSPVGGYASISKGEKIAYITCSILCFASLLGIFIIGMLFGFHENWSFYLFLLLATIAGLSFMFILIFCAAISGEEIINTIIDEF